MFTDPLTLAIVSMIIGMLIGVICCVIAFLIHCDLHATDDSVIYPSDADMDQMCLWYEAEYGQKGAHEK